MIKATDKSRIKQIQLKIDNKTKPVGALGQLESLALQLALIQNTEKLTINHPTVLVFAADHGIASRGVSIAPSEVTTQMVSNFIHGGAAINCFCESLGLAMTVIDAGIKQPLEPSPSVLVLQSVGRGTKDFSIESAMSDSQLNECLALGAKVVNNVIEKGSELIAFGEMGIGNTTSASTILSALTGLPAVESVGRGTGITDEQLALKVSLVELALSRPTDTDALSLLREYGGFEIAQIVGGMLTAAQKGIIIVVDGFIVTSAALIAHALEPNVIDYMVFSHCSKESAHMKMLDYLGVRALLDLDLRLGEGTGAALSIPLIQAACAFYNDMATFASAGVTV